MTSLERYHARRAAGLCYMCGEPSGGKCTCDKCSEYIKEKNKAIYNYRSQIGICTKCGKEPAAVGRKICDKCREYNKQHPPKKPVTKEEQHKYYVARREKQRADKICYICNAAPADSGRKSCAWCREKMRLQKNTQGGMRRIERLDNDLCWLCGEPVWGMHNVCEKHYNMLLRNLGISKEAKNGDMGK